MSMKKRLPPHHLWLVVFDGLARTIFSGDVTGRYSTYEAAVADLNRKGLGRDKNYSIVKYVRETK